MIALTTDWLTLVGLLFSIVVWMLVFTCMGALTLRRRELKLRIDEDDTGAEPSREE